MRVVCSQHVSVRLPGVSGSVKEASSSRLLKQEREPRLAPVICYSVNRISGEMDLLACPLQRNEGRPLPRRCHLRRGAIVNARLGEKSGQKKKKKNIHTHLEFQWWREMKRRVEGLGGQRRSRSCGFSLSLAASLHSFQHSPLCNLLLFITAAELLSHCNTFLFARIARRRNFTFDPENMWGLAVRVKARRVWLHTWLLLHLDLHVQYSQLRVVEQWTWLRLSLSKNTS